MNTTSAAACATAPRLTCLAAAKAGISALAVVWAAVGGCLSGASAEPLTVFDASGRDVEIADTNRVVSIGGSITEILYALGLQDRIIAIDTTSIYPPEALAEKPNVGYLRALSPEGVLSTNPSLILTEDDAGPAETVAILESASVPFVRVPGGPAADGVAEKIRFVSSVMGVPDKGGEMAGSVTSDLKAVTDATAGIADRSKVLFVLSLSNGRILAAGEGTSAAAMIEMAGGENAVIGFSGYKPVNDEAVIEAAPDIIVMMARGGHASGPDQVFAHPALAMTPAAERRRLVTMDGLYLLGFGPRVAHAVHDLAHAIYPDLTLPEMPDRPWTRNASGSGAGQ